MAKSPKLSEEMVVQILSRSRPKALMRFKCVHKSWFNLISHPSFVAHHLSISVNNKFASSISIVIKHTVLTDLNITDEKEILDILMYGNNDKKEILLSVLNLWEDAKDHGQELYSVVEDDFLVLDPLDKCSLSLRLAGHCDGVICLLSGENVALCNPSIKEFNLLPKSCLLLPPKKWEDYENEDDFYDAMETETNAVGFGYDSEAKVYKVVRVVEFSSGYLFTSHPSRVEVYTLGENCWREIQADLQGSHVWWNCSFEMLFKGIYYWEASTDVFDYVTLGFDMSHDVFYVTPHPENTCELNKCLVVWKESLVLITFRGDSFNSFDMWLNEDYDRFKGSWNKYLTIGPIEITEIPLMFWRSEEILLMNEDRQILSYNVDTRRFHCFQIHAAEESMYIFALTFVNSIISVKKDRDNKIKCINTFII